MLNQHEAQKSLFRNSTTPKPRKLRAAVKAQSRLSAQGQISVPAPIRKLLELATGSVLEWTAEGDTITVRRVGTCTTADLRKAVFPNGPPKHQLTLEEMDAAIVRSVMERHARR